MNLILTIVGLLIPAVLEAAPQRGEIPLNDAAIAPADKREIPLEKSETVDVHIPPPYSELSAPEVAPAPHFNYALGLKGSLLLHGRNDEGELELPTTFGIFYRGPFLGKLDGEFAISIVSEALGLLEIEPVFYLDKGPLRLYAKPGLAVFLDPSELLATLGTLDNYAVQGAVGLEDMLFDPISVKIEFGFRTGMERSEGFLTLGYSWSW